MPVQYSVIIKWAVARKLPQPYILTSLCFIFQNSIMKIRKGCVSMRFLKFVGKMVLKLVALPVLFVLGLICLLAKLVVNVSSFAIGALILYILGCCIYCVFNLCGCSLVYWLELGWRFMRCCSCLSCSKKSENISKKTYVILSFHKITNKAACGQSYF